MKSVVAWILRLLLGGTFVVAAATKIADPAEFVAAIHHFRLLPYPAALILGLYLPWLELVCGLAVLVRWRERAATWLPLLLTVVFVGALASALARGLDLSCGCFGHATTTLPWALARAAALGGGAGAVLWLGRGPPEFTGESPAA